MLEKMLWVGLKLWELMVLLLCLIVVCFGNKFRMEGWELEDVIGFVVSLWEDVFFVLLDVLGWLKYFDVELINVLEWGIDFCGGLFLCCLFDFGRNKGFFIFLFVIFFIFVSKVLRLVNIMIYFYFWLF